MLSERELQKVVQRLPLITLEGPFHRFADFWFVHQRIVSGEAPDLLRGLGARMFGGRFTSPGKFETVYVATAPETARIEAESILTGSGIVRSLAKPYVHFTINGLVEGILDLGDVTVQKSLGTTRAELSSSWRTLQARGHEAPTQMLGRVAHGSRRVQAIPYRSSKNAPEGQCLAILPDRLVTPSWLQILDDSGQLTSERLPHLEPKRERNAFEIR
jgi:RES domain-containing protein